MAYYKGECVTCATNTDKMNTSYRTSSSLGAEKLGAGKGIKNYARHMKNDFQLGSYSEAHQKDGFWVIRSPGVITFRERDQGQW